MFREKVVYRVADYPVMPMKKVKLYAPGQGPKPKQPEI